MHADTSIRLRLVEIATPGGLLRFGGGFACVLAAPEARSDAARWIATTVAGPRPVGADGTIEIAGRLVSVRSLPSLLLAPSAPSVVGADVLRAQWRTVWDRRRGELGAAHAARRLARHRAEAALDRARARAEARLARPAASAAAPAPGEPRRLDDERLAELRARLVAAQERVVAARRSRAAVAGPATGRGDLDALHREVVVAEAAVSEARRRGRAGALARYEAAVRAEQEALAAAGFESYASLLVAVAQGALPAPPSDPAEVDRAYREVALAEAALAAATIEGCDATTRHTALGGVPEPPIRPQERSELDGLARERDLHAAAVEQLEAELARLDAARDADVAALQPDEIVLALSAVLDAYRRGELLAGCLPLVFDGALDGLRVETLRAALAVLARAGDVQSIVVSDDAAVADVAREAGAAVVAWARPPMVAVAALPRPVDISLPELQCAHTAPAAPAAVSDACCAVHTDTVTVASCARCGRACCVGCLVYVIGEPDLWCAPCARAGVRTSSRPARLLRRRA